MTRILVLPHGHALAHTSRPLEVARYLRRAGADVVFAGEGEYLTLARDADLEVLPLLSMEQHHALQVARAGRANWLDESAIDRFVKAELELFERARPDAVLSDFRLSASISCELAQVRHVSLRNAAWTNFYDVREAAPLGHPITNVLGERVTSLLLPIFKGAILWWDNKPHRAVRKRHGLPARKNVFDAMAGDLNLLTDLPEYAPTRHLPDNYRYVGPIMWEPDIDASWLDALEDETVRYITMGSTGDPRFFDMAIEAFGDGPFHCVLATGGLVDIERPPKNFTVVKYAPGRRVMEKSAAVICQGGNGTVYQAIVSGTPMVGIPTMHDQSFNLSRVEALGLGVQLHPRRVDAARLRSAVETVMQAKYRDAARAFAERAVAYDGPNLAAQYILNTFENLDERSGGQKGRVTA